MKKNILSFLILVFILLICVGGIYIIKYYNTETNHPSKIAENNNIISNETNTINDENVIVQDNNNNNNSNNNNSNSSNNNVLNVDTSKKKFEIVKVKENDFKNNYEIEKPFEIISKDYLSIEKEDNNVVIILVESTQNKELLKNNKNVILNKKYTIENVSAEEVNKIFCGGEGQDLMYPVVYLLLNDGTVKGIDIEDGYNTGKFKAEIISGLENVQKIEQTSVTPPDDSGYEAVVAITKDETVYEIRKVD